MNDAPGKHLSIIDTYAESRHMERDDLVVVMMNIIMPKGRDGKDLATMSDMIAFLQIANRHNLDPFAGEVICIIGKGGKLQPYITYKGFVSIANRHPQYDGFAWTYDQNDSRHIEAVTCTVYRKDRSHPAIVTEFYDERVVEALPGRGPGPWQKSPSVMLRQKAFSKAIEISFGITSPEEEDLENMDYAAQPKAIEHVENSRPRPPKRTPPPAPNNSKKEEKRPEWTTLEGGKQEVAHDPETGELFDGEAFLTDLDEMLASAKDKDELATIFADFEVQDHLHADKQRLIRAHDLLAWHGDRLARGLKT